MTLKRKLVIVCEEATMEYGNYLLQLISAYDDKEGEQIGTKDGTIEAILWTEREYEGNRVKLSSNQRVLFIGNSKAMQSLRSNVQTEFFECGMAYGWIGCHGFMHVDDNSLNAGNYERFRELCEQCGKEFKELSLKFDPAKLGDVDVQDAALALLVPLAPAPLLAVGAIAGKLAIVGKAIADIADAAIGKGNDLLQSKEAERQQYSLLTLLFYMRGLGEFVGE